MSLRSGLAAQLGIAEESTWGTRIAPTTFFELDAEEGEDLGFDIARDEAFGLRASTGTAAGTYQRTDRWAAGKKGGAGSIPLFVTNKSMGKWFKHAVGLAPNIATPGGGTLTRDHTYTHGDPFGLGLTVQVGVPDVAGTIRVKEHEGCKVTALEFDQQLDAFLTCSVELDSEEETTSQTLATASYPTGWELFHWSQLTVTIGGSATDLLSFNVRLENPLKTDRYFLRSSTAKKEPILNGKRRVTGSFELELDALTQYTRYTAGTHAAIVATWTGSIIEAALAYRLILTMNDVRFDGATPKVGGADTVIYEVPFEALYDGTDAPFQIEYRTTDTAA